VSESVEQDKRIEILLELHKISIEIVGLKTSIADTNRRIDDALAQGMEMREAYRNGKGFFRVAAWITGGITALSGAAVALYAIIKMKT